MTICRSKKDGSLWKPSCPDGYNMGHALAAMVSGKRNQFYFRGVRRVGWWIFSFWKDTGDVWEPESGDFEILGG